MEPKFACQFSVYSSFLLLLLAGLNKSFHIPQLFNKNEIDKNKKNENN